MVELILVKEILVVLWYEISVLNLLQKIRGSKSSNYAQRQNIILFRFVKLMEKLYWLVLSVLDMDVPEKITQEFMPGSPSIQPGLNSKDS